MTEKEAFRCIAMIAEAWPSEKWSKTRANLWADFLAELDEFDVAIEALKNLVRSESFPPSIATIREAYRDVLAGQRPLRLTSVPDLPPEPELTLEERQAQAARVRKMIVDAGLKEIPRG